MFLADLEANSRTHRKLHADEFTHPTTICLHALRTSRHYPFLPRSPQYLPLLSSTWSHTGHLRTMAPAFVLTKRINRTAMIVTAGPVRYSARTYRTQPTSRREKPPENPREPHRTSTANQGLDKHRPGVMMRPASAQQPIHWANHGTCPIPA